MTLILKQVEGKFQSTLPARGSDNVFAASNYSKVISIHAPRKGERLECDYYSTGNINFNPRSPQGGATGVSEIAELMESISIHAPRKGERHCLKKRLSRSEKISIHAPRKGERHSWSLEYM